MSLLESYEYSSNRRSIHCARNCLSNYPPHSRRHRAKFDSQAKDSSPTMLNSWNDWNLQWHRLAQVVRLSKYVRKPEPTRECDQEIGVDQFILTPSSSFRFISGFSSVKFCPISQFFNFYKIPFNYQVTFCTISLEFKTLDWRFADYFEYSSIVYSSFHQRKKLCLKQAWSEIEVRRRT
jgi:hypothetical protein